MARHKKNLPYQWRSTLGHTAPNARKATAKKPNIISRLPLSPVLFTHCFSVVTKWELPDKKVRCAIVSPFGSGWIDAWRKVARWCDADPSAYDGTSNGRLGWTSSRLKTFEDKDGMHFLRQLHEKGANSNFILSILVKYLWNEAAADFDYFRWEDEMQWLRAINMTHYLYLTRSDDDPEHSKLVEESLLALESTLLKSLEATDYTIPKPIRIFDTLTSWEISSDYKPQKKRKSANDKMNRIIFTIHGHVNLATNSHQWPLLAKIFRASGAITGISAGSPDRLIKPHLENFSAHHMKESRMITKTLIPESATWRIQVPT